MATLLLLPLPLFHTKEAGLKILPVTITPGSHSVVPSWWYQRMRHKSTGTPGRQTGWNGAEGRVTREEGGHSPRTRFWVATWKRACVFITLPWPSWNLFWDSLTLLRSLCDSGGPLWPLYLGRRIPEKMGASLVPFVIPLNHSVFYWKICSHSCLPNKQPMAGLPPRTHASLLVDSIRLCTQELVGSSLCLCAPCPPSSVLFHDSPFPPPRPPVSWPPPRLCLGCSRQRGVCRVLTAYSGSGGTRARCGPCAGCTLRS